MAYCLVDIRFMLLLLEFPQDVRNQRLEASRSQCCHTEPGKTLFAKGTCVTLFWFLGHSRSWCDIFLLPARCGSFSKPNVRKFLLLRAQFGSRQDWESEWIPTKKSRDRISRARLGVRVGEDRRLRTVFFYPLFFVPKQGGTPSPPSWINALCLMATKNSRRICTEGRNVML